MGAVAFCIACLPGLLASVQATERAEPQPEDIIVTGERVNRSLRETASSVSVTTEGEIERQAGVDRIEQLLESIPNVQMSSGGLGPTIRGQDSTGVLRDLPAFLGGSRPRVTLQVDGRTTSYFEYVFSTAPLWDVQQVEVFRTPQTTTQGANSIAGAIFIRTNDPEFDWQGRTRLIHGSLDLWQGSAVVTGPIVDDQIAFRIAADIRRGRPASDIVDNAVGGSTDRDDYDLIRMKLRAEPDAAPWLKLVASYAHSETYSPQLEGVRVPFRARKDPLATYGVYETKADSLTTKIDAALGDKIDVVSILSASNARFQRFAPLGLGQHKTRNRDFSAETIFNWRPTEKVRARGGVYLSWSDLRQRIDISGVNLGIGRFKDKQESRGLFGEFEFEPASKLILTAGLRHQSDRQHRTGTLGFPGAEAPLDFQKRFSALLPKLSVAYDLTEELSVGLLVQRAFNSGGMTLDTSSGQLDRFGAESLWNYEGFARSSFANGRLRLAANVFYNDIKDAQRPLSTVIKLPNGLETIGTQLNNAPRASSYGLEAEADWRATERLSLRAALGLLGTRIDKTVLATDAVRGKEFQRAPHITASGGLDWQPTDRLRISGHVRHHGSYFSNDLNSRALRISKATKVDARVAYERGPVTLFGYARNLLNDFSMTYLFANATSGTAADPREIGVGLEAAF